METYEMKTLHGSKCSSKIVTSLTCLWYLGDGQRADGTDYQLFFQYRETCEEKHFTYPLLYSENPVELCNVSESLIQGTDVWVGVYRQRLFIDNSDKTGNRPGVSEYLRLYTMLI